MKKVLSIILVVAMLFSMSMSAFASAWGDSNAAVTLDSGFDFSSASTPFVLSGGTANVVKGAFGKDANDESVIITEGTGSKYFYMMHDHGEPIYLEGGSILDGYLIIEFNFKLVGDGISFVQAALSGRQHSLSHKISPNTEGYNSYGWNNVRVVYDPSDCGDLTLYNGIAAGTEGAAPKGTKYGNVTTYLNGVPVGATADNPYGTMELLSEEEGWFNMGVNSILIQAYSGDGTGTHDTYIDDIKVYKSDWNEAPFFPYLEDGDTYTVVGNNIILSDTTAVDTVINNMADTNSAIAYVDSTLAAKVSGNNLSSGNVIVARSSDGEYYTYFTVSDPAEDSKYLVNNKNGALDGLTKQKFTVETATGVGGKHMNDISTKLTSWTSAEMSNYDGNGYIVFDYTKTSNYLVAEFNYYPTDSMSQKFFVLTNGNANVAGHYVAELNKWSKVMVYIDFTGESTVAHMYVNGVKVAENVATGFNDKSQLRIGNYGEKEGDYHTAYIDDIRIYETAEVPADTTAPAALASSDIASVSGNIVTVKSGTKSSDLAAANADDSVRGYTNSSCTANVDVLYDGAVIVVESAENASLNYYTVAIENDSSIVYQADDATAFTNNVVRAAKSPVTGLAGKAADDESIKLVQNKTYDQTAYTMYYDMSWGTSTSFDSWDKSDYVGYLVYEINLYNESLTSVYLATDQNTPVSNVINASDLEEGKWNKIAFVLDFSGGANTGKSFIYVNGNRIDTGKSTSALGTEYASQKRLKNTLRLLLSGAAVVKNEDGTVTEVPEDCGTAYIDNINVYESTGFPDLAMPELGSEYIDADGRFTLTTEIKVSDITSDYTVRVYEDDSYAALVADDAAVADGNVIVVENESGSLTYYPAENWDGTTLITNTMPTSFNRGSVEAVTGVAGKAANDTVYKITRTNESDSNVFSQETWSGTKLNDNSKYIVFEANIMPTSGYNAGFHFATNTHKDISSRVNVSDNTFFPGRWNKIVAVMDLADNTVDTYANGKLLAEDDETLFGTTGFNAIRFVLYLPVDEYMYADDYRIYEAIDYPEIDLAPERVNGIFEDVITTNDLIYTTADMTVADIKALYTLDSDESIKVCTGLDMAKQLADNAVVTDGAVVLISAPGENYYYNIIKVVDEIPAAEEGKITVLGDASGEFTIITKAKAGNLLAVKQINNLGKLISIKHLDFEEGDVVYSFHPNFVHGEVRAFVIDSVDTMKPLAKVTTLECTLGEAAVEEEAAE